MEYITSLGASRNTFVPYARVYTAGDVAASVVAAGREQSSTPSEARVRTAATPGCRQSAVEFCRLDR